MAKMISVEKMDEIMNDYFPAQSVIDYYGQELVVNRVVSFDTVCQITQKIASACFQHETGEYMPEVMDFAIRMAVIEAYTNISLPKDSDHLYALLYRTDLWERVRDEISEDQLDQILNSIYSRVKVKNDINRTAFENAVQQAITAFGEISMQLSGLFEGFTPEDAQKLIDAITAGGLDEEKLVRAVLDAQEDRQKNTVGTVQDENIHG